MAILGCSCPVLLFLSISLLLYSSPAGAQQQRPHGLQFETPMSFPPSAFEFFHPDPAMGVGTPVASTSNSLPNPSSSKVRADQVHESGPRIGGGSPGAAGGVAAVVLGVVLVVLVAIGGVSYAVLKRGYKKGCSPILPKV